MDQVSINAYVRDDDTHPDATVVDVIGYRVHPDFDAKGDLGYDFMLLLLDNYENMTNASTTTVKVNANASIPVDGDFLTTMGMGNTQEYNSSSKPNVLHHLDGLHAINTDVCNGPDSYRGLVDDESMMCAGNMDGGVDACGGDSGGPLVGYYPSDDTSDDQRPVQVGVVSWGAGCGRKNYPSAYARVSAAYHWIRDVACGDWNITVPVEQYDDQVDDTTIASRNSSSPPLGFGRFRQNRGGGFLRNGWFQDQHSEHEEEDLLTRSSVDQDVSSETIATTTTTNVRPSLCEDFDFDALLGGDGSLGSDSSPCQEDEVYFGLKVKADAFGHELSWELLDVGGHRVMGDLRFGDLESRTYHRCVSKTAFGQSTVTQGDDGGVGDNCFTLNIKDSVGDGLCCGDGAAEAGFAIYFGNASYQNFDFPNFGDLDSFELCLGSDSSTGFGGAENGNEAVDVDGVIVDLTDVPTTSPTPYTPPDLSNSDGILAMFGKEDGWEAP